MSDKQTTSKEAAKDAIGDALHALHQDHPLIAIQCLERAIAALGDGPMSDDLNRSDNTTVKLTLAEELGDKLNRMLVENERLRIQCLRYEGHILSLERRIADAKQALGVVGGTI